MPIAHLIHGYIGAGKTTFARKLEKEQSAVRFSADEWMVALYGHNPPVEHFAEYFESVDELIWKTALDVLQVGCDVIIDSGFWTRVSRDTARRRLHAIRASAKFYSVSCPDDLMRVRTVQRSE